MSRAFSIYLDLLRFLAACLVVIYHSSSRPIVAKMLPLSSYGHTAVIVFFVLSGYVIAYATDTKERSAGSYWASSRVWSLAVPAILLTPVLGLMGEALAPGLYAGNTTHDHALICIEYFAIIGCMAVTVFLIGHQTARKRFRLRRWLVAVIDRGQRRFGANRAVIGSSNSSV